MNLCYEIASRIYRHKNCTKVEGERSVRASKKAYWAWQYESSEKYFSKFGDLFKQMQGKKVLDVGCGLGGRTAFLSTKGVEKIVGSDVNRDEIGVATELADEHDDILVRGKVQFVNVEENADNDIGLFDIVILVDSMEHLRDPSGILSYAYSVTKLGGICYFGTVGWYNHRASHLGSIIPIPFATVFFSDAQILDAVKRIVQAPYYHPSMWDSVPPIKRWEGVNDLKDRPREYLNKITIADIKRIVRASEFEMAEVRVAGFDRWFVRPFNFMAKIPWIQEMYHSGVFGRLEKAR